MSEPKYQWKLAAPMFIEPTDERYPKHMKQLEERGFSDTETWALESVIAEFILPRLIRFKEVNNGFPATFTVETWDAVLDKMIFAFDWSLHNEDEKYDLLSEAEKAVLWKNYDEGMQLFAQYFRHLWW